MAVKGEFDKVETFEDWYTRYAIEPRDGTLRTDGLSPCAQAFQRKYDYFKREMDARVANYWKYEKIADASVVNPRADFPNVSSGDAAGFIRRIARAVVQHTPNVTVTSMFDDDQIGGVIPTYIVKSKIIRDDEYSNYMQQQLYATMVRGGALGFDCVIPTLLQDALGTWYIQYDNINYRDVFPEPGVKDVRRAPSVFIRRYLTRGEIHNLIRTNAPGWDVAALKSLLQTAPIQREHTDTQSHKHRVNPEAYEVITWYSDSGAPFLTWAAQTRYLLRIEKNKDPLKRHPVFFFIPEYDGEQPFGRSLLSLIYGRQEFQDWFMNGALKLWRLNIEPPIIGYGVVNALPNIAPGKYTQIPNPNAKIEPFEISTQALLMFSQISTQNSGNMAQLVGATDQQMAAQSTGGMMSQTPQGVEAQQQLVDVTINNYQKAMEAFFSQYVSYATTIYFQELKSIKKLTPTAEARKQLINAGMPPEAFVHEEYTRTDPETGITEVVPADGSGLKNGELKADFAELAVPYYVKVVPGSLAELEDEKQLRILNQVFVSLTQSMGAIAAGGDPQMIARANATIQFIIQKIISLSGSNHSRELEQLFSTGRTDASRAFDERANELESAISGAQSEIVASVEGVTQSIATLQEQQSLMGSILRDLAGRLGVQIDPSAALEASPAA